MFPCPATSCETCDKSLIHPMSSGVGPLPARQGLLQGLSGIVPARRTLREVSSCVHCHLLRGSAREEQVRFMIKVLVRQLWLSRTPFSLFKGPAGRARPVSCCYSTCHMTHPFSQLAVASLICYQLTGHFLHRLRKGHSLGFSSLMNQKMLRTTHVPGFRRRTNFNIL